MPQPRVNLRRAVDYLTEHGETQANALAEALGLTPGTLTSAITPAVLEGTVAKRKDGHHVFYSLGDGVPKEGYKLPELESGEFNASLWADGDLVIYGVRLNDDGNSVTISRARLGLVRRLLLGTP